MNASQWAIFAESVGGSLVVLAGWWKWVRPRVRRARNTVAAITETLIGRDAIFEKSTGKELAKPVPGLGVRMASVEDANRANAAAISALTETMTNLFGLGQRVDGVERRVEALERAQIERIAIKAESAQMLRLAADERQQQRADEHAEHLPES